MRKTLCMGATLVVLTACGADVPPEEPESGLESTEGTSAPQVEDVGVSTASPASGPKTYCYTFFGQRVCCYPDGVCTIIPVKS